MKIIGELAKLPGAGKETERDLFALEYKTIESLKGAVPEKIYEAGCLMREMHIDICQLYVYRYTVCCAENRLDKTSGVKWWDFKDKINLNNKKAAIISGNFYWH